MDKGTLVQSIFFISIVVIIVAVFMEEEIMYQRKQQKNPTNEIIHITINQCINDPDVHYIEIVTNKSSAKFQVR
jgi:hypothetical protein